MAKRFPVALLLCLLMALLADDFGVEEIFAQASAPTRIRGCESRDDSCKRPDARLDQVWTFNGVEGTAISSAGQPESHITIEKFSSDSIVLRRIDESGATAGLTALYTGTVSGARISGTVQWSWPGHPDYPVNGIFSAVLDDQLAAAEPAPTQLPSPSNTLPEELLVCENNGVCNAAWILHGSEGTGTWFARNSTRAKLTVLRSEPDYHVIRRTDITDGLTATYTGRLHGDHYSGTIIVDNGSTNPPTGTWTATVPKTKCDPQAGEASDAIRVGQAALMFHRDHDALNCYIVAANSGNALAETTVGLIYYQGRETIPQDYTKAFYWLHKAADNGVYAAQRTVAEMYLAGQGTSRDPVLAGIYTARADEQKHDLERQQDLADREADRRAEVLSSAVLGVTFGAFLFF